MRDERKLDMLENADDKTIELLSGVPVLSKEEKARMLAMSKKKLDKMNKERNINISESADEVSGVERYQRPKWHKFAALAACLVLAGGIAGTALNMNRGRKNTSDTANEPTTINTTSEDATGTSAADHTPDDEEMTDIREEAAVLLTKLYNLNSVLNGTPDGIELDANDTFTEYGIVYKRVTGEWNNKQELRNYLSTFLAGEYFRKCDDRMFSSEYFPFVRFTENDGKLYFNESKNESSDLSLPLNVDINDFKICNYNGSSFDLTMDYGGNNDYVGVNIKRVFHVMLVAGHWKISDDSMAEDNDVTIRNEKVEIANEVIAHYQAIEQMAHGMGIQVNKDKSFKYNNDTEESVYNEVVNSSFRTLEDVKEYVTDHIAEPMLSQSYTFIYDSEKYNDSMFKEINGKLYFKECIGSIFLDLADDVSVYDFSDDSLDIRVRNRIQYSSSTGIHYDSEYLILRMILEDGKWKLKDFENYEALRPYNPENGDPETIAQETINGFNQLLALSKGIDIEKDSSDTLKLDFPQLPDNPHVTYERVTDPEFTSIRDIEKYFSERTYGAMQANFMDECMEYPDAPCNRIPTYVEQDGKLYCYTDESVFDLYSSGAYNFTGKTEIVKTTESTITFRACVDEPELGEEWMLIFLRLENGKWKISSRKYL